MQFAPRLEQVETSAIREIFKHLGKPGLISFAGGFPDAKLFDIEGVQTATEAVLSQEAQAALQYSATEGWTPLKQEIVRWMQTKGAPLNADELMITTGSQQALDLLGKTMVAPGDVVIVEAPTFLATIQCFRLYGANVIQAPIDAQGVDVDALERLIIQHQPKMIYLIPTFGNPSGACMPLERRKRVLELARQYQVLVVEDDPYGDLYFGTPPPPSLLALSSEVEGSRDFLAHCGSLSKILAPGLRLGWMIAPPALLAQAVMCKQFSDANSSTLAQAIAARYLASNRLPAHLERVRAVYSERAEHMATCLEQALGKAITFSPPQGGMFIWARLTDHDASAFAQRALDKLVAFVPGKPFYAEEADPHTLRLSFATSDKEAISEGVRRLAEAL